MVDEAKELATYGDRFAAWAEPDPEAAALRSPARTWSYGELVAAARAAAAAAGLTSASRVMTSAGPDQVVGSWLAPWVADGSLVLVRRDSAGTDDAATARRAAAERVTDLFG